jgi:hypothetical protein
MNPLEAQNNQHTEQLAAKASRLKNVRKYLLKFYFNIFYFIFKIAIDIDNETKEHNRFLETMVIEKN